MKTAEDGLSPANNKIPSSHPQSPSNAAQPVVEPLEMESAVETEMQYPSGLKFAVLAMALGLSLAVVGLVSLAFRQMLPEFEF